MAKNLHMAHHSFIYTEQRICNVSIYRVCVCVMDDKMIHHSSITYFCVSPMCVYIAWDKWPNERKEEKEEDTIHKLDIYLTGDN